MKFKKLDPRNVEKIVVHCSATTADQDYPIEQMKRDHLMRGFADVAYHIYIRRDGLIQKGRPLDVPGAHARGFNHKSIGVCLEGGANKKGKAERNFTDKQYDVLWRVLGQLWLQFPWAETLGHRDLPRVVKGCPSFDVREWIEERRNDPEPENPEAPS